jgi:(5-formylfuran-3-yl)methyl phosphate synthase
VPFSAAFGDPRDGVAAAQLIAALPIPARPAPTYVKVGLARAGPAGAEQLLGDAVQAALRHAGRPLVIAVAYADAPTALGLHGLLAVASRSGASGVLLDTLRKAGGSLLEAVARQELDEWIAEARALSLLVALAGRLDRSEVALVAGSNADVVGVRGAACEGGRGGWVSAAKVRALRDLLDHIAEERPAAAKHQSMPRSSAVAGPPN